MSELLERLRRALAPDYEIQEELAAVAEVPRPLATIVEADRVAASQPQRALRLTERMRALDAGSRHADPFARTALHLLRAQWYAAEGDRDNAVRELRWQENSDVGPRTLLLSQLEVDWAFGTLGRWQRARLLDAAGRVGEEVCGAYAAVARL